jgi:5-methylcytosine-specific restriction endonuclease McrA
MSEQIKATPGLICAICHLPPTDIDPLTAGHITPRARGGTNHRSNYQPEHGSCNSRKNER